MSITLDYREAEKVGEITFENGRKLRISNVTKEQAEAFVARHAPEFAKRDCVLHAYGRVEGIPDGQE